MNLNTSINSEGIKNTLLNFITPIIALVITVALGLIVILPSLSNLPIKQAELSDTQALESNLRTKLSVLNRLLDFTTVVEEDGKLFTQALTDEPMVPELLTQIDQIARESGLAVTKLNYSITDAQSLGGQALPYNVVVVNLDTLGTYDQISTFLSRLETAARLVDMVNFRFASESSAGEGIFSSTFILSSPYRFVSSRAVTDVPVTIDITDARFLAILEKVKALKFYDITASTQFTDVEESPVEEVVAVPEVQETTPPAQ